MYDILQQTDNWDTGEFQVKFQDTIKFKSDRTCLALQQKFKRWLSSVSAQGMGGKEIGLIAVNKRSWKNNAGTHKNV